MLYIGSDYAGYTLKESLKKYFQAKRIKFVDVGSHQGSEKDDFTDFVPPVVTAVRKNSRNRGILICGTGFGMDIAANRFSGIRATLIHTQRQAQYARTHDNANVLVLSAWQVTAARSRAIVDIWMRTQFRAVPRRLKRFKIIDAWHK